VRPVSDEFAYGSLRIAGRLVAAQGNDAELPRGG